MFPLEKTEGVAGTPIPGAGVAVAARRRVGCAGSPSEGPTSLHRGWVPDPRRRRAAGLDGDRAERGETRDARAEGGSQHMLSPPSPRAKFLRSACRLRS